MIFRAVRRFARLQLRRPTINPGINPQDIFGPEDTLKQIKKINELLSNPGRSPLEQFSNSLKQPIAEQLKSVEIQQVAFNGEKVHKIYYRPYNNSCKVPSINIVNDFSQFNPTQHFSFNAPALNIQEYGPTERQLFVFNLPADATSVNLQSLMPEIKMKSVSIGYCLAGLPAYAKILTESVSAAQNYRQKHDTYDCQNKTCLVRGINDNSIVTKHRMLAIQELPEGMTPNHMFSTLSRFGRVMNFHMPMEMKRRMTKQEVKEAYKNSKTLIRIVEHKTDGTKSIEYYPEEKPNHEALRDIELQKYIQDYVNKRVEYEKRLYEARIRNCEDVECYEQPSDDCLELSNKGYCIVVFSCMEEAQNCYFHLMNQFKLSAGDQPEFTFDSEHRKKLLRYISNRVEEKQLELYKNNKFREEIIDDEYEINWENSQIPRDTLLTEMMVRAEYAQEEANITEDEETWKIPETAEQKNKREQQEALKQRRIRGQLPNELKKKGIGAGKSFSQFAQMELFGAVLPKKQRKQKEPLNLELEKRVKYVEPMDQALYGVHNLQAQEEFLDEEREVQEQEREADKFAQSLQDNKFAKKENKKPKQKERKKAAKEEDDDGEDRGRARFSTGKIMSQYREPTQKEKYQRIRAYNSMIKELIEEFFGKFSDQKLSNEDKTFEYPTLNRHQIFKTDKTDFLTEEQLPVALQMHCCPTEACESFETHIKLQQLYKSMPYGWREDLLENMKNKQIEIQQHLSDIGVVEQVFKLPENEDPVGFVKQLNLYEAPHGENFELLQKDGRNYAVKTARIEPKLDIVHLERFNQITERQIQQLSESELREAKKMAQQMWQTGEVPQSIKAMLGNDFEGSIQKQIERMVAETGLPAKFFETLYKSKPSELIKYKDDFDRQMKVEAVRRDQRKPQDDDFVKGVQMADVKKKNGRYRTSRYKQI